MVTIVQNVALPSTATNNRTATVCEPTAAANDRQLVMTGNWFASTSTSAGTTWALVDPIHALSGISWWLLLRSNRSLQSEPPHLDLDPAVRLHCKRG